MRPPASPPAVVLWSVGPCTVDLDRQLLLREGSPVPLRPKAWILLSALLRRPNAVVGTSELVDALWPRQHINPKQLVNTVSELRAALGGGQTLRAVHRRGFLLAASPAERRPDPGSEKRAQRPATASALQIFLGREEELGVLRDCLRRSPERGSQWVEIVGPAGVGKSSLLTRWLAELAEQGQCTVLQGHAVETAGDTEPFGPLIQMLADHAQVVGASRLGEDLQLWAPCWLAQLPGVTAPADVARVAAEVYRSGEGRMRREGAELIGLWAAERPVVLALEDVQWADAATLDMLSLLAQRARRQPVLIVTTRRVTSLGGRSGSRDGGGPLPLPAGPSSSLALKGFGPSEVKDYLAARLPGEALRDDHIRQIHQLTDGLPLFLKTLADVALARGLGAPTAGSEALIDALVPQLREVIVERAASLCVDQRALLDLACCIAEPVAVPVLALALEIPEATVEARCEHLVRAGLFAPRASLVPWQGQRLVKAYGLVHSLYREALFGSLSTDLLLATSRRLAAAMQVGSAGAPGGGPRMAPLFSQLGMHEEAAAALRLSGMRSLGRFSTRHAVKALQASLQLLQQAPQHPQTLTTQLETLWDLSRVMLIEHGATDERVEAVRDQIDRVAPQVGTDRALFLQLATRCARHVYGGRADLAGPVATRLQQAAAGLGPHEQAIAMLWQGSASIAQGVLARATAAFDSCLQLPLAGLGLAGLDARAIATTHRMWLLAVTGQVETFAARLQALEAELEVTRSAYLRVLSSFWMADALRQLGCVDAARRRYHELIGLCTLYDSQSFVDQARAGLLACEPPEERDAFALLAMSSRFSGRRPSWSDPMLSMTALEGLIAQGRIEESRQLLDDTESIDRHWPLYQSERLRLAGDLENARCRMARSRELWGQALVVDLERGWVPGLLRHLQRQPSAGRDAGPGDVAGRLQQALAPLLGAEIDCPDLMPLARIRSRLAG